MGRGSSKIGNSVSDIGKQGTGLSITVNNRQRTYVVLGGQYRELHNASYTMSIEQGAKLIQEGHAQFLSKEETTTLQKKRNEELANKPDYEMGLGTPLGNKNNRKAARASRLASRRR